jgi:hypothetical protein
MILVSNGDTAMVVKVVFTPPSEKPITLTNMTGITMIEERSEITSANITFANTPTMLQLVDDFGDHCAVQIFRDNEVIFDGDFINDNTNNNRITLQCWDKLYWLSKSVRSFTQTTDDITASEAFEQAFDEDATFSYWTKVFAADTYATPFASAYSFDATTYNVPVNVADQYDDFFDGQSINGVEFMKFLASAAKRGTIYDYYYWYEYKDGTRYLHFEPSGWGKTVDSFAHLTINRDRNRDNVFNNIHVWGQKLAGKVPADGDDWTDNGIDDWATWAGAGFNGLGAPSLDSTHVRAGFTAIRSNGNSVSHHGRLYRPISGVWDTAAIGLNFETLQEIRVQIYKDGVVNSVSNVEILMSSDTGFSFNNYYESNEVALNDNNWTECVFTAPSGWAATGTPDWTNMHSLAVHIWDTDHSTELEDDYWIDGLFLTREPIKSANSAVTSGYDSTSETNFGLKETSVDINWLKTVTDCNSMGEALVGYYANIHPTITYSVPFFLNEGLNNNIKGPFYGTEYTLPIHRKTSIMNADGVWITTVQLGKAPMSFYDIISKHDLAIKYNQYDAGLTYNTV